MLCNPLAAAHFGSRSKNSILPLLSKPRMARGGVSSPYATSAGATQLCPREAEQEKKNRMAYKFHPCVWPWEAPQMGWLETVIPWTDSL